jgi:hypothetical protein
MVSKPKGLLLSTGEHPAKRAREARDTAARIDRVVMPAR